MKSRDTGAATGADGTPSQQKPQQQQQPQPQPQPLSLKQLKQQLKAVAIDPGPSTPKQLRRKEVIGKRKKKKPHKAGARKLPSGAQPEDIFDHEMEHEVEAGVYSQKEFLLPGTDAAGHSKTFGFDCPPGYSNEVSTVLASKRFPYKTSGQLMRHALHRHLVWLTKLEGDLPNDLELLESAGQMIAHQELLLDQVRVMNQLSDVVVALLAQPGLRGEAVRMVWDFREKMQKLDEPAWRERMLTEIEGRWGNLLTSRRISLVPSKTAEEDV